MGDCIEDSLDVAESDLLLDESVNKCFGKNSEKTRQPGQSLGTPGKTGRFMQHILLAGCSCYHGAGVKQKP